MDSAKLPKRVFPDGEEPVGDRVNSYFKLSTIGTLLKLLQPAEVDQLRPWFGKLFDVYAKPGHSGKLAHFLLARQLKVAKRHEIWVIFGGKPIKFSLREYAIVTGLNCNPLPTIPSEILVCKPGQTPYYYTLFGGEPYVTGEMLLSKLKKGKQLSSEIRVKYACLILVDGLISRRSARMKIPRDHIEMIRELDYFLSYPWGRFSFDMMMGCIKTRQKSQLAQPTVAIQGFIHALQLVLLESVPDAISAVGDSSDTESGDEENKCAISLKLERMWELDRDDEVDVISVIQPKDESYVLPDCTYADEVEDPAVDYMVQRIDEGYIFSRGMFSGGDESFSPPTIQPNKKSVPPKRKRKAPLAVRDLPSTSVSRTKKANVRRTNVKDHAPPEADIMELVDVRIKDAIMNMERSFQGKITSAVEGIVDQVTNNIKASLVKLVEDKWKNKEVDSVIGSVVDDIAREQQAQQMANGSAVEVNPPKPLRLETQHTQSLQLNNAKRKALASNIDPNRELPCDGIAVEDVDLVTIPLLIPPDRTIVMDSCVMMLRESVFSDDGLRADIMPTSFIASLAQHYPKFKKTSRKEGFDFNAELLQTVRARTEASGKEWVKDVDVMYMPFNLDRNRWVAVIVDLLSSSLTVLDSGVSVIRASRLKPEFDFMCEMLPYFVRQACVPEEAQAISLSPLTFSRDPAVLQVDDRTQSGVLSLMFIEAHVAGGMQKVCAISESMIRDRAEQLAAEMLQLCNGDADDE